MVATRGPGAHVLPEGLLRVRGQEGGRGDADALQRVARYPPEALIAQPMLPADTMRSAILLRAVVPEIENRAQRLRDDLEGLSQARREMAQATFDVDASGLMRTFLAELTFCCKYGQKRSNEVCGEGCHYTGYLCYAVRGCLSNRFPVSVRRYAQALAWLMGDTMVTVEHLRLVLPYTAAHRIQWRDDDEGEAGGGQRSDAYPIHRARAAVDQVIRRYTEQSSRIKEALTVANRVFSGEDVTPLEGEHPIYQEIKKDLGV